MLVFRREIRDSARRGHMTAGGVNVSQLIVLQNEALMPSVMSVPKALMLEFFA